MAGADHDDMASLRGRRGELCLQARPARAETAGEAARSAQDNDGHVRKGPCGGAHLPHGRKRHGGVIVQLIGVDGEHDPPPPLEWQGQETLHLLVPGIHQDQARNQVRLAEGQQLDQDAAQAVAGQDAWSRPQPGNNRCQVIDHAGYGRQTWRGVAAAQPGPVVGDNAHVRGQQRDDPLPGRGPVVGPRLKHDGQLAGARPSTRRTTLHPGSMSPFQAHGRARRPVEAELHHRVRREQVSEAVGIAVQHQLAAAGQDIRRAWRVTCGPPLTWAVRSTDVH